MWKICPICSLNGRSLIAKKSALRSSAGRSARRDSQNSQSRLSLSPKGQVKYKKPSAIIECLKRRLLKTRFLAPMKLCNSLEYAMFLKISDKGRYFEGNPSHPFKTLSSACRQIKFLRGAMKLELRKMRRFHGRKGPLLLIIMDGVGIGKHDESDAVFLADTPNLDRLFQSELSTRLKAHGTAVGLPSDGDMGNSEVGHNAFGAGRVFAQGAQLVNHSVADGSIFRTENWNAIIKRGINGGAIHFIGLLSDGNVHSHIDHLFALVANCAQNRIQKVRVHALLDGRDVGEKTALRYIEQTEQLLESIRITHRFDYKIASGGGRMVTTMDRYNADWSVVKRGWDAHVLGKGRKFKSARDAVETFYNEDEAITDQYLPSFVITDDRDEPVGKISNGDSVVYFNFRGDRAIEISRAFEEQKFDEFDREYVPDIFYAGMMQYDGDLHIPKKYLVNPPVITDTVSEYLCGAGVKSFAISETQKFGHVTYFWNGNRSGYIDEKLEKYIEIPSDRIAFDRRRR
jgi:2,3-bisphosphoglycerate-independent phosphoglycerate mutase